MAWQKPIPKSETFAIGSDEPVYVIGVVSELVQLPIWTLRILDREGLVRAKRRAGRGRLYSMQDLGRLQQIRMLMVERGVNIQGIRVILHMSASVTAVGPGGSVVRRRRR